MYIIGLSIVLFNNHNMSSYKPIQIVSFSKKNILLRLIDSDNYHKWDRIFCKMGACRNNSNEDPGWIISKDKLDDIEDVIFREEQKNMKKRSKNRSGNKKDSVKKSESIINKHEAVQSSESKGQESQTRDGKDEDTDETDAQSGPSNRSRCDDERDDNDDDDDDNDDDDNDEEYSSSEDYSTEEDESSDDELIQKVLARRLKYQSSQKVINETKIEDSDQEDVISHSRRFRYLYDTIKLLEERISALEVNIKNRE